MLGWNSAPLQYLEVQVLQTSSGEAPIWTNKGTRKLSTALSSGKEKAEPKVTQNLSPVVTVGTLRGGR